MAIEDRKRLIVSRHKIILEARCDEGQTRLRVQPERSSASVEEEPSEALESDEEIRLESLGLTRSAFSVAREEWDLTEQM
jgi:hypothetical protein